MEEEDIFKVGKFLALIFKMAMSLTGSRVKTLAVYSVSSEVVMVYSACGSSTTCLLVKIIPFESTMNPEPPPILIFWSLLRPLNLGITVLIWLWPGAKKKASRQWKKQRRLFLVLKKIKSFPNFFQKLKRLLRALLTFA